MTRKAAPSFSMGPRTSLPDDSKRKPGPGNYDPNINAVKPSKAFSLGVRTAATRAARALATWLFVVHLWTGIVLFTGLAYFNS